MVNTRWRGPRAHLSAASCSPPRALVGNDHQGHRRIQADHELRGLVDQSSADASAAEFRMRLNRLKTGKVSIVEHAQIGHHCVVHESPEPMPQTVAVHSSIASHLSLTEYTVTRRF